MINNFSKTLFIFVGAAISSAVYSTPITEILPGQDSGIVTFSEKLSNAQKVRVNVFVHGTVGFESAALNPFKVFFDKDLKGSKKEALVRGKYRKKDSEAMHFDDSITYEEGFFRVCDPSSPVFDLRYSNCAIFPLVRYFDCVSKYLDRKNNEQDEILDLYYVFGWSGLLSQSSRVQAGICFYNALGQELSAISKMCDRLSQPEKEIFTKVITHSHGGNAALNAAFVSHSLSGGSIADHYDVFKLEKVGKLVEDKILNNLKETPEDPEQALKVARFNSDKWLFKPKAEFKKHKIDELVMLACPIQVETWPAAFLSYFKNVANIFSASDKVQRFDFMSAKNSFNMIKPEHLTVGNQHFSRGSLPKVVQVECVYPKTEIKLRKTKPNADNTLRRNVANALIKAANSTTKAFFFGRDKFSGTGPSHLEFWLVSWAGNTDRFCIRPFPLIVFQPMFSELWTLGCDDLVLRLRVEQDKDLDCQVFDRSGKCLYRKSLDDGLFGRLKDDLKNNVRPFLSPCNKKRRLDRAKDFARNVFITS